MIDCIFICILDTPSTYQPPTARLILI